MQKREYDRRGRAAAAGGRGRAVPRDRALQPRRRADAGRQGRGRAADDREVPGAARGRLRHRRSRTTTSNRDATPKRSPSTGAEGRPRRPRRCPRCAFVDARDRAAGGDADAARRPARRDARRSRSRRRPRSRRRRRRALRVLDNDGGHVPRRLGRQGPAGADAAGAARRRGRRRLRQRRARRPVRARRRSGTRCCTRRDDGTLRGRDRGGQASRRRPVRPRRPRSSTSITTATSISSLGRRPRQSLLRNNGNGTFADVTAAAGIADGGRQRPIAVVPTDFDNRRDVDLLIARGDRRAGAVPEPARRHVPRRRRDEVGAAAAPARITARRGRRRQQGRLHRLLLRPRGRRRRARRSATAAGASRRRRSTACDGVTRGAVRRLRQRRPARPRRGHGRRAVAASGATLGTQLDRRRAGARRRSATVLPHAPVAARDLDARRATSTATATPISSCTRRGRARAADRAGERRRQPARRRCASRLTGRVSNRSGVGSKVEMRAGSLRQKLETSSAWPAVAPADIVFGLGARAAADVVRVLWPAGIVQAEMPPAADAPAAGVVPHADAGADRARSQAVVVPVSLHLERRALRVRHRLHGRRRDGLSGTRRACVSHAGSRGVRADPRRSAAAARRPLRAARHQRARGGAVRRSPAAGRGRASARTSRCIRAKAWSRRRSRRFELYAAARRAAGRRARSIDAGPRRHRARSRALDRRFVDDLPLERDPRLREAARADARSRRRAGGDAATLLLLTGWTDYAFSSDNVAAHQAGLRARSRRRCRSRDADGRLADGDRRDRHPGRPAADDRRRSDGRASLRRAREVRIVTSMRIYWDQMRRSPRAIAPSTPRLTTLDAAQRRSALARLLGGGHAGRPRAVRLRLRRASRRSSPWKLMPGRYTREGDVRELLARRRRLVRRLAARRRDRAVVRRRARCRRCRPAGRARSCCTATATARRWTCNSASPDQAVAAAVPRR